MNFITKVKKEKFLLPYSYNIKFTKFSNYNVLAELLLYICQAISAVGASHIPLRFSAIDWIGNSRKPVWLISLHAVGSNKGTVYKAPYKLPGVRTSPLNWYPQSERLIQVLRIADDRNRQLAASALRNEREEFVVKRNYSFP